VAHGWVPSIDRVTTNFLFAKKEGGARAEQVVRSPVKKEGNSYPFPFLAAAGHWKNFGGASQIGTKAARWTRALKSNGFNLKRFIFFQESRFINFPRTVCLFLR